MSDDTGADGGPLDAGEFSAWLAGARRAIAGTAGPDVPCGTCSECCTSAQFVHIGPGETDTLAHIPAELRVPAPLLPPGHVVLGYDERGRCPMLVEGRCSIYAHRPRACRAYDCRVFPATGTRVDGHPGIDRRARRWVFAYPSEDDRARHRAARSAAVFLDDHPEVVPAQAVPLDATRRAVLALVICDLFTGAAAPSPERVRAAVRDRVVTGG